MLIVVTHIVKPITPEKDVKEMSKGTGSFNDIRTKSTVYIWSTVFSYAAIEEFIFRFIPLGIIWLIPVIRRSKVIPLIVIVLVGGIFGYLHGNYLNILLQGTGGILLGMWFWQFMKEREGGKFLPLRSFLFVSCIHMFYNLILFYIE
jgi:membrane protease YdiL (CAAX protease family)